MARTRLSTQVVTGAVIVVVGVLLLLATTGVYDVGRLWRYVPSLFVLLGVWAILGSGGRNLTGPLVLIVVAGTIQLLALGLVTGETVATWWPLAIVLFGLWIVLGHWRRRSRIPSVPADDFDLLGIFGGSTRRIRSDAFTGGTATAVFGGVEVDLRDAQVADPQVAVDALPLFGAVEDERRRPPADVALRDGPDLVLTGFVAFGGISVTD